MNVLHRMACVFNGLHGRTNTGPQDDSALDSGNVGTVESYSDYSQRAWLPGIHQNSRASKAWACTGLALGSSLTRSPKSSQLAIVK